ncbi:MAG: hypothetical protein QME96_06545 [Myxococcota bacterium]|nr:hypothetical protein [Myxococcota bacterium]
MRSGHFHAGMTLPRAAVRLAIPAMLVVAVGCRSEFRRREAGVGRADAPSAVDAPSAADASPTVIVPPPPSGWAPGMRFDVPPPVTATDVPADGPFNMLANPGFEEGTEPWWYFPDRPHWGGFVVSDGQALSGRWAARLDLRVGRAHPPPDKTHIRGFIQSLRTPAFPARLSGSYFVERWERGATDTYVQFVIIAVGAAPPGGAGGSNTQIRYLLAGIDRPPFGIANAKFVYVSRSQPEVGRWIPFERDLRRDFTDLWGFVPESFESIRVLYEVRYDNLDVADSPEIDAVVWFDDLYLGN